jgi:hypothetical protein
MAKKKRSFRSKSWKFPILPIIGVATSFNDRQSILQSAIIHIPTGDVVDLGADIAVQTIGFDPRDKGWRIPTLTVSLVVEKLLNKALKGVFRGLPLRW